MSPIYQVFRKCFTSGITVRLLYTSCRALGQHLTLQATFRLWYKTADKVRSQTGELKDGDSARGVQGTRLMEPGLTAADRAEHLPLGKVGRVQVRGTGHLPQDVEQPQETSDEDWTEVREARAESGGHCQEGTRGTKG